jgi:hypothetical protein
MSDQETRRADIEREQREEQDAWRRFHFNEPAKGERLGCPHCGAYEFSRTVLVHHGFEFVADSEGKAMAQGGDVTGDEGTLHWSCEGCDAKWDTLQELEVVLVLRSPDDPRGGR